MEAEGGEGMMAKRQYGGVESIFNTGSNDALFLWWSFGLVVTYTLGLPYRSVASCARLTMSPCHLFLSSAALFS